MYRASGICSTIAYPADSQSDTEQRAQAKAPKAASIYSKDVDGDVEGTLEVQAHRLTIGPNGTLRCHVKAREVAIFGNVQGKVDADEKIEVRKDASVVGDVTTERIVIEDGAYFKGSVDIVKHEPAKSFTGFEPESRSMPFLVATPANS